MKTLSAPVRTVLVARSGPGPTRVLAVAALLVGLSVARPWADAPASGTPPSGARGPGASAVAVASSTATPRPSPGRDEIACPPTGWQIVSLDRLANWTVRTWTPAAPALAGGPLDPAIPEVSLESPAVLALGICAPAAIRTDLAMTGMRTWVGAAWQRDGAQLRPLALETIGRTLDDRALAVLYRPVDSGELLGSWPSGHFVLELGLHDGANASGGAEASGPPLEPAARFIALSVPGPG